MKILIGFVVCLCVRLSLANFRCLYCQESVLPTDCDTVITCGSHQMCYVDAYVSIAGFTRYNLGCRDSQQCLVTAGKRHIDTKITVNETIGATGSRRPEVLQKSMSEKSVENLICSDCCAGNLCSNNGCGTLGYPAIRGPICWNCHRQQSYSDCSKITMCQQDEVCVLRQTNDTMMHTVRYETKCELDTMCVDKVDETVAIDDPVLLGRRQSSANVDGGACNTRCCETDLCNNNCDISFPTTTTTTEATTTPPETTTTETITTTPEYDTNSTELTVNQTTEPPTTVLSEITYATTREQTPETISTYPPTTVMATPSVTPTLPVTTLALDPCFSNPCLGGVCSAYMDTYRCSCISGYYGRDCQNVVPTAHVMSTTTETPTAPPCDPNVCVNGTCRIEQASVVCDCYQGYTGQICDVPVVCQPNFKYFGGKCYKVLDDKPRTFSESEAACSGYGAHLATVKTAEDKDSITNACLPGGLNGYWIGANDRLTEGDFRWIDNSRVVDGVQYWDIAHGQPDNMKNSEDCVELIMLRNFEWFDTNCNDPKIAICEYP